MKTKNDRDLGTWTSRAPAWSPNGEFIYFTAVRSVETGNMTEQIWVKPVAGGAESQLTAAGVNTEATVRRIVAPTITNLVATPNVLWPSNNKFVAVSLAVGVTDNSDPAPVCEITDVTSNERLSNPHGKLQGLSPSIFLHNDLEEEPDAFTP